MAITTPDIFSYMVRNGSLDSSGTLTQKGQTLMLKHHLKSQKLFKPPSGTIASGNNNAGILGAGSSGGNSSGLAAGLEGGPSAGRLKTQRNTGTALVPESFENEGDETGEEEEVAAPKTKKKGAGRPRKSRRRN